MTEEVQSLISLAALGVLAGILIGLHAGYAIGKRHYKDKENR